MKPLQREFLKAPFPYFGGKSRVASIIWDRLGDVPNYVEPFFGSGAVLLGRKTPAKLETVNDVDHFITNFWRAIKHDPEGVLKYADDIVSEADLHSRHYWLVTDGLKRIQYVGTDPHFYDIKVAGWWAWGMSTSIGRTWCLGTDCWSVVDDKWVKVRDVEASSSDAQKGIERSKVHLSTAGVGMHKSFENAGIRRSIIHLSGPGRTLNSAGGARGTERRRVLLKWFNTLCARLERVRVTCGDWSRVLTPAVTTGLGLTGVFLDPPYSGGTDRDKRLYVRDDLTVAHDVREWAIQNGSNPMMRIVLAGYDSEHDFPEGWVAYRWRANGGFGNQKKKGDNINRERETLWFSPHCVRGAGFFNGR